MMWLLASTFLVSLVVSVEGQQLPLFQFGPMSGDCRKFILTLTKLQITWNLNCQKGMGFSTIDSTCVPDTNPNNDCNKIRQPPAITIRAHEDAAGYCQNCPTCLYPDLSNCAGFYNCSKVTPDPSGNLRVFQDECVYPALFDAVNRRCDPNYKNIENQCGERALLLAPCDQKKNKCGRVHCKPCVYRYPSCIGKRNGFQEWAGRALTPYYARCQDGRTLEAGTCARSRSGSPRIFSAARQECIDVDGKTFFNN